MGVTSKVMRHRLDFTPPHYHAFCNPEGIIYHWGRSSVLAWGQGTPRMNNFLFCEGNRPNAKPRVLRGGLCEAFGTPNVVA